MSCSAAAWRGSAPLTYVVIFRRVPSCRWPRLPPELRYHSHNTAKSGVARAGVYRLGHTCGRAVTLAVIGSTQVRSPFEHLTRDADIGLLWVITPLLVAATRVCYRTAGFVNQVMSCIPVGCPFPDVADHVIQPKAVGGEDTDW